MLLTDDVTNIIHKTSILREHILHLLSLEKVFKEEASKAIY